MNNIKLDMSDIYEIIDIAFKNNQSIILNYKDCLKFSKIKSNTNLENFI